MQLSNNRGFYWRLAHQFAKWSPPALGAAYATILGLAAQAERGTDVRTLFDNQMLTWRDIILAPHGWPWFVAVMAVWAVAVIWTGAKQQQAEKGASESKSPQVRDLTPPNLPQTSELGIVTTKVPKPNVLRMRAETGSTIDFTGANIVMENPAISAQASDDSTISFAGARIGPPGSLVGDINQNHSGSGDNVINFGKQPFQLSDGVVDMVAKRADRPVRVHAVGAQRSLNDANELVARLAMKGIAATVISHSHNLAPSLSDPVEFREGTVYLDSSK